MAINSADWKLELAPAASKGELLNSAVKPADPMGSIGAPTAILINERRLRAVGFDMVSTFLFIGLVLSAKSNNEAIVKLIMDCLI